MKILLRFLYFLGFVVAVFIVAVIAVIINYSSETAQLKQEMDAYEQKIYAQAMTVTLLDKSVDITFREAVHLEF